MGDPKVEQGQDAAGRPDQANLRVAESMFGLVDRQGLTDAEPRRLPGSVAVTAYDPDLAAAKTAQPTIDEASVDDPGGSPDRRTRPAAGTR